MNRFLKLQEFGRFNDTEIPLGKTTVIVGGNESGKTTVYRALRAAATGDSRAGRAQLDAQTQCVTPAEFDAHHGAAEGCIRFATDAAGEELGAVLNEKLAATIDLSDVLRDLDESVRSDASAPRQQELCELRARYEQLELDRQNAWSAQQLVLDAGDEIRNLADQIATLEQQLVHLERELPPAVEDLEFKRGPHLRAARHAEVSEQLHRVREQLRDVSALRDLDELDASALETFDRIDAELQQHLEQMQGLEERKLDSKSRLGRVAEQTEEARAEEPLRRRASHRATAMKLRLLRFLEEPKTIERRVWSRSRVAGFSLLIALVAVAAVTGSFTPHVGFGLSLTVVSLTLFLGRSTERRYDDEAVPLFLQKMAAQWDGEGLPPMPTSGTDEVLSFMDAQIRSYEQLRATLAESVDYECRVERELAEIVDCSYGMLQNTLAKRQKALDDWLEERGIESRDVLMDRRRELQRLRQSIASRADLTMDEQVCAQLESKLEAQLGELVADGIVPYSDEAIPMLEERLQQMQREQERVDAELAQLKLRRVDITTRVGAQVEYAQRVSQAVAEQRQVADSIKGLEEELRVHEEARRLLSELATDGKLGLSILNEVLAEFIEAADLGRSVELRGFSEADILVGAGQSLGELSSGVRDLVVLAARLAVSRLLHGEALPLLTLEEPFQRMDRRLTLGALRMLQLFQRHTGWQLILISRDEDLPERLSEVFAAVSIVNLNELH